MDFPGSSDGEESVCNVRDLGSISGLGIPTPVEGDGNQFWHSSLENPMDRGATGLQRTGHD